MDNCTNKYYNKGSFACQENALRNTARAQDFLPAKPSKCECALAKPPSAGGFVSLYRIQADFCRPDANARCASALPPCLLNPIQSDFNGIVLSGLLRFTRIVRLIAAIVIARSFSDVAIQF
jgi:hypothetical protein